jgi:small GTP-binding protein
MLGAATVGKTSLVRRFVEGIFSDVYLTTIGVKIDKKVVVAGTEEVQVLLWDLSGEDAYNEISMSYMRGAAGYLLVADGTRPLTLDTAQILKNRVDATVGPLPFVLALNKADLSQSWDIRDDVKADLDARGWQVVETSAKNGQGVEEAFSLLVNQMLS